MDHFQIFFDYVELIMPIPEYDRQLCRELMEVIKVPKNTVLEGEGTIPQYHNFLVSGFMRLYHHDEKGKEVTTDIGEGPRWFTSYFAFMNKNITNENLECITDCEILRMTRDAVDISAEKGITQKDYSVKILNHYLEHNRLKAIQMASLTADQRYEQFCKDNPRIIQNVPLGYIASLLGITQRHLSRLRGTNY